MDQNTNQEQNPQNVTLSSELGYHQYLHKKTGVPYTQIKLNEKQAIQDANMDALMNPSKHANNIGINSEIISAGVDNSANELLNVDNDEASDESIFGTNGAGQSDFWNSDENIDDTQYTQVLFDSDPFISPNAQDPHASLFAMDPAFDSSHLETFNQKVDQINKEEENEQLQPEYNDDPFGELLTPDSLNSDQNTNQ